MFITIVDSDNLQVLIHSLDRRRADGAVDPRRGAPSYQNAKTALSCLHRPSSCNLLVTPKPHEAASRTIWLVTIYSSSDAEPSAVCVHSSGSRPSASCSRSPLHLSMAIPHQRPTWEFRQRGTEETEELARRQVEQDLIVQ